MSTVIYIFLSPTGTWMLYLFWFLHRIRLPISPSFLKQFYLWVLIYHYLLLYFLSSDESFSHSCLFHPPLTSWYFPGHSHCLKSPGPSYPSRKLVLFAHSSANYSVTLPDGLGWSRHPPPKLPLVLRTCSLSWSMSSGASFLSSLKAGRMFFIVNPLTFQYGE